jgi:hypothetical protein
MDASSSVNSVNTNTTLGTKNKKKATISHELINSLAEPKSMAHVLDGLSKSVHKNLAGNFAILERESQRNVDRIQIMLNAAELFSARQPAPDGSGNHISRAAVTVSSSLSVSTDALHDFRVKRKSPRYKYEKATLPTKTLLEHPDWNDRFVHAESLELPHRLPKLNSDSKCDYFFDDYRIGGAKHLQQNRPDRENDQELYSPTESMIATYLFQKLPRKKHGSLSPLPLAPNSGKLDIAQQAVYERNKLSWEAVLGEFYEYAEKHIAVKDLSEIANLREPAAVCLPIIGYLCHLFGLLPSWPVAKKYIFKDVNILRRFLNHVSEVVSIVGARCTELNVLIGESLNYPYCELEKFGGLPK